MTYIDDTLKQRLADFYSKNRKLTVLTGAGLSADSGIPTLENARCGKECSNQLYPYPNFPIDKGEELTAAQIEQLKCEKCGSFMRPHVLWFDEMYNERYYKLDSSLRTAKETGLLLIVGTSGATNLPRRIVESTLSKQGIIIDVNPNRNYFSDIVKDKKNGYSLMGKSSDILPEFVELFRSFGAK